MNDYVRIIGLKEPYLTYGTRRLRAGDEMDMPRASAVARIHLGLARPAGRRPAVAQQQPEPQPAMNGDDLSVLRALATSLGIEVDGRWKTARLMAEIAKKR